MQDDAAYFPNVVIYTEKTQHESSYLAAASSEETSWQTNREYYTTSITELQMKEDKSKKHRHTFV